MHTIKDRARLLIDMAGFTRLIREGVAPECGQTAPVEMCESQ